MHYPLVAVIRKTDDVKAAVEALVTKHFPKYPRYEWSIGGRYAADGEQTSDYEFAKLMKEAGCSDACSKPLSPPSVMTYDQLWESVDSMVNSNVQFLMEDEVRRISTDDVVCVILDMHNPDLPEPTTFKDLLRQRWRMAELVGSSYDLCTLYAAYVMDLRDTEPVEADTNKNESGELATASANSIEDSEIPF